MISYHESKHFLLHDPNLPESFTISKPLSAAFLFGLKAYKWNFTITVITKLKLI